MADRRLIRASDEERENVVAILREHTAQGRLTLDEFDERMNAAYAAKTWEDLRPLTMDLPAEGAPTADVRTRTERSGDRSRPRGGSLAIPRMTYLIPLAILAVILTGSVVGEGFEFPIPLLFIGLFFAFCGRRGCRPRSSKHH